VFLHNIVPLIFGLLCVLFMYVFAGALFSKPAEALLAGVISCSLAFGWHLNLDSEASYSELSIRIIYPDTTVS